jgi:hypothetical protein
MMVVSKSCAFFPTSRIVHCHQRGMLHTIQLCTHVCHRHCGLKIDVRRNNRAIKQDKNEKKKFQSTERANKSSNFCNTTEAQKTMQHAARQIKRKDEAKLPIARAKVANANIVSVIEVSANNGFDFAQHLRFFLEKGFFVLCAFLMEVVRPRNVRWATWRSGARSRVPVRLALQQTNNGAERRMSTRSNSLEE